MVAGVFVARRSDECHNSVSPDMILEQSYNDDAKEEGGLDGIMTNAAATKKWVYTKPITPSVSTQFKEMVHLNPGGTNETDWKPNVKQTDLIMF